MPTHKSRMPTARQEQLIVEEVLDETIIYDLERNRGHSLNRTAALVWRHCDGQKTVPQVARLLAEELEMPPSEPMVWMALNRLAKARLLEQPPTLPGPSAMYSRRAVMQTLGAVGRVALVLPVVHSILTPLAAQAQSCLTGAQCRALSPPACNGQPICGQPGTCCMPVIMMMGGNCRRRPCA